MPTINDRRQAEETLPMPTGAIYDGGCPRLPVLGWSAFSGDFAAPLPGVLDARHRRYTISGRAAIVLALRVLGIEPGDKVLLPTYHCPTMITPVVQADAEPMFYPVTAAGGPDLQWLARADLNGVKTMLVTHYFGRPQPMLIVRGFCADHRLSLIEDCAHAFFGVSDDIPVGSWGDVAIASLTKFFPVPEGGLITSVTRSLDTLDLAPRGLYGEIKAAADAVEVGAAYHRFPGVNALLAGVFGVKNWLRHRDHEADQSDGGYNAVLTPAVERLLSSSRPAFAARWIASAVHRSRIVELRRRNFLELGKRLERLPGAHALWADLPEGVAPYVFPLYVDDPEASYQRLRATRIPIFRWDEIWPGTPTLPGDHGLDWATHVFQLGCHQDLSVADVEAISAIVRKVISGPRPTPG